MQDVYDAIASIDDRSLRGYASQLLFRAEVVARGFAPSTPEWPLSLDHILIDVKAPRKLLRVEVKQSQQQKRNGSFLIELRGSQGIGGSAGSKKGKERLHPYSETIDLFAIFLPKARCWYLIPEFELRGRSSVTLNPSAQQSTFSGYKDAWDQLDKNMHEVRYRRPSQDLRPSRKKGSKPNKKAGRAL